MLFGDDGGTQFSWLEYQALMLCLAGVICGTLFFVEIALNRFQVLPLLFPGMFSVHERRFYLFENFDISDGPLGKTVRAHAKMVVRMTICLVLSYLWQHCVLETSQKVGFDFPIAECNAGADCFSSRLHFTTLFNREYEAIDCKGSQKNFEKRAVVSCIRFVPPTATTWLMHLAISHSVTQLNFKAFELLVWIGGNSKATQRILACLIVFTFSLFIGLFFGGVMSEFVSSWLSFVMSLTIPLFLHAVYKCACALEHLWKEEAIQISSDIEEHLNGAFADIETAVKLTAHEYGEGFNTEERTKIAELKAKEKGNRILSTMRNMKLAISNSAKRKILRSRPGSDGTISPRSDVAKTDTPPKDDTPKTSVLPKFDEGSEEAASCVARARNPEGSAES
jgi:hypothetical protein